MNRLYRWLLPDKALRWPRFHTSRRRLTPIYVAERMLWQGLSDSDE